MSDDGWDNVSAFNEKPSAKRAPLTLATAARAAIMNVIVFVALFTFIAQMMHGKGWMAEITKTVDQRMEWAQNQRDQKCCVLFGNRMTPELREVYHNECRALGNAPTCLETQCVSIGRVSCDEAEIIASMSRTRQIIVEVIAFFSFCAPGECYVRFSTIAYSFIGTVGWSCIPYILTSFSAAIMGRVGLPLTQ